MEDNNKRMNFDEAMRNLAAHFKVYLRQKGYQEYWGNTNASAFRHVTECSSSTPSSQVNLQPLRSEGIIGYWLRNRYELSIPGLFERYYQSQLSAYQQEHGADVDAWDRDLQKEFVCEQHIKAEFWRIKRSLAVVPPSADTTEIENLAKNYLRFACKKKRELYAPVYPSHQQLIEPFLNAYREGGPAWRCMYWLRTEHNLPLSPLFMGNYPSDKECRTEEEQTEFEELLPLLINEGHDTFNREVLMNDNSCLMEEINENLKECRTQQDRVRYLITLLQPFKAYADAFYPIAEKESCQKQIDKLRQEIDQWQAENPDKLDEETGHWQCPQALWERWKDQLNQNNAVISYLVTVWRSFNELANHGRYNVKVEGENLDMCRCLNTWVGVMEQFGCKLAALALTYGIDLNEVQHRCKVFLNPLYDATHCVDNHYISAVEHAQWLFDEIKQQKEELSRQNSSSNQIALRPAKRTRKNNTEEKKNSNVIPYTLRYYTPANAKKYGEQRGRVIKVFQSLIHWGWIDPNTQPEDFEKLFAGEYVPCHIQWITSSAILTCLLKKLRVQSYIVKQVRCSVNAIMNGQFGKKTDHNANRISEHDNQKIDYICKLLDISIPLKSIHSSEDYHEVSPAEDLRTLAQYEVLSGNMRVRKSV